ncbi:stability determinant [Castellaniella sp.]|uniref:type II toxin-antitoxin system RelB family antitoxin n=1 Tax=Castellaniella sp. TaxID=1955812 RepID=UPI00355DD445
MSTTLSPIVSEFETEEQAASHDRWFRAKVQASRDDPRPSVPHDEAMARIRQKLAAKVADQEKTAARSRSRDV